jgi:hypothetical protein
MNKKKIDKKISLIATTSPLFTTRTLHFIVNIYCNVVWYFTFTDITRVNTTFAFKNIVFSRAFILASIRLHL